MWSRAWRVPSGNGRRCDHALARAGRVPGIIERMWPGGEHMVVATFQDDDAGYVQWVAEHTAAYVLNIQRRLNASDARLHTTACGHLARAIQAWRSVGRRLTVAYIKVCSS